VNYKLLEKLLPYLEQYENQGGVSDNIEAFGKWFFQKAAATKLNENLIEKGEKASDAAHIQISNSRLIVNMYRYAKRYARTAIPSHIPIAFDDYSYCVVLFYEGKQTKIQLIERNIHEKSTGMEVIKRLIKLGIVAQEDNENDKRSKLVSLTSLGIEYMNAIQGNMWALTQRIQGNLTETEAQNLYFLLEKLDNFHNPIFLEHGNIDNID
jgi:MarR family transcriptional regulator, lower aerobic nicotinate degradation pathway regulator